MSKRHFEAVAAVFADYRREAPFLGSEQLRRCLARGIGRVLAETHPGFDHERFMAACKLTGDEGGTS